jgi:hypothetical protein
MFTLCWNYYDVYAYIPGQVTIIDSHGTGPRTRVYAVRCMWVCADMPYLVR